MRTKQTGNLRLNKLKETNATAQENEPQAPDVADCPVKILGRDGSTFFFITPEGIPVNLTTSKLDRRIELVALFGHRIDWLQIHFPAGRKTDGSGFDSFAAAQWLVMAASQIPLQSGQARRSTGVWPSHNAADCVDINLGQNVVCIYPGSKKTLEFNDPYISGKRSIQLADQAGTLEDADRVASAINCFHFDCPEQTDLALGWVGLSFYGAALRWRPHLCVTSPQGTGKSTFIGALQDVLGAVAFQAGRNPSAAYLWQELDNQCVTLLVDEAEDNSSQKTDGIVLMARHMSDADGATVGRGTSGGTARNFRVSGNLMMAAISPPVLKPQDRSRFVMLQLKRPPNGGFSAQQQDLLQTNLADIRQRAPFLLRYMLERWTVFRQNERAYRRLLLEMDGTTNRFADQAAALLAGYDTLLIGGAQCESDKTARVAALLPALQRAIGVNQEEDGDLSLAHLLSTLAGDLDRDLTGTVAELILDAYKSGYEPKDTKVIRRLGLTICRQDEQVYLAVSNTSAVLNKAFRSTAWVDRRWIGALRQLDGAKNSKNGIHFHGKTHRATLVPIHHVLEDCL